MKTVNGATYMEADEYELYLAERQKKLDEQKEKLKPTDTGIDLYSMNQGIVDTLPALRGDEVQKTAQLFFDWIDSNESNYYMLLCNELRYYTVFHNNNEFINKEQFWSELIDIANSAGQIKVLEVDSNGVFSIWLNWNLDNKSHLFYLFPYEKGVVEL